MAVTVWDAMLDMLDPPQPLPSRWPTPGALAQFVDPRTVQTPALDLIDAELVRLLDTPDSRLIVSMPPQEGKSVRVAGDFPAWVLTHRPDWRVVTASYGQDLANRNGRSIRRRFTSHDLGHTIASDNGSVSDWTLEGHTGGVFSVGIGGGVTGRPADMLVIDDPIKNRQEAESAAYREKVWDWWTDEASARLAPGAPVVLIMTRWHEDDLAARLLDLDAAAGWRLLNIPAEAIDPVSDPLGRQPGEFMQSARGRTQAQWEQRKTTAGPRTWEALYQGHPSPLQGDLFKRDMWQRWDSIPDLTNAVIVQSWDLAFKNTAHSDYVVGQVWARIGADLYLLDQVRGRWTFSETCQQITALSAKWPQAVGKYVEDKANGPAVIDALRGSVPGLVPVEPQGGKEARAAAVEPLVAAGNVWLPRSGDWVPGLIEEAAAFPNGAHDDQVDALTQALTKLMITREHVVTLQSFDIG